MRTNRLDGVDLWHYERQYLADGHRVIVGIDEAGRGPLAGPVVAAAVALPFGCDIDGIFDSKQLSEKKRDAAFAKIHEIATGVGIGIVDNKRIDRINILQATYEAMRTAVVNLGISIDICLIDGLPIPHFTYPHVGIVSGDAKSASIAAASIIAKVTRDRIMCEYDSVYPQFGFARHKGYPTKDHMAMLAQHGVCEIHRRSFGPVAEELTQLWKHTEQPSGIEANKKR